MKFIKKAEKNAVTTQDETRGVVEEMLAKIEKEKEKCVIQYTKDLDDFDGNIIVSKDEIERAQSQVSQQTKDDIQFAFERVTKFAKAQLESVKEFETELSPGLWAGQRLIPMETVGCYVPGGTIRSCGFGNYVGGDCESRWGEKCRGVLAA